MKTSYMSQTLELRWPNDKLIKRQMSMSVVAEDWCDRFLKSVGNAAGSFYVRLNSILKL